MENVGANLTMKQVEKLAEELHEKYPEKQENSKDKTKVLMTEKEIITAISEGGSIEMELGEKDFDINVDVFNYIYKARYKASQKLIDYLTVSYPQLYKDFPVSDVIVILHRYEITEEFLCEGKEGSTESGYMITIYATDCDGNIPDDVWLRTSEVTPSQEHSLMESFNVWCIQLLMDGYIEGEI